MVKLNATINALLENAKNPELIQHIETFSNFISNSNFENLIKFLNEPELAEHKMKLSEAYIPFTPIGRVMFDVKLSIIQDFSNCKPYLSPESIQDLKLASIDLIDSDRNVLKEMMAIEKPSEFDSIRAINTLIMRNSGFPFYFIMKYASLWADMPAPFQSLLAVCKANDLILKPRSPLFIDLRDAKTKKSYSLFDDVASTEDCPNDLKKSYPRYSIELKSPAGIELAKAKTPEEWFYRLENPIYEDERYLYDLELMNLVFSYENVLSPQSPYVAALEKSCEIRRKRKSDKEPISLQELSDKEKSEKIDSMIKALLEDAQKIKASLEIIDRIQWFAKSKCFSDFRSLTGLWIEPKLTEKIIKLGEVFFSDPSFLHRTQGDIIENYDKCKPYLSPETIERLKIASLDLLDQDNKHKVERAILGELMRLKKPSEFDSIRAVNAVLRMINCAHFHSPLSFIKTYRSLWADMSAPFQSLLAVCEGKVLPDEKTFFVLSVDISTIQKPNSASCMDLTDAKTPEEWTSLLDQVILSEESLYALEKLYSIFGLAGVLRPDSPYLVVLKTAIEALKMRLEGIKTDSMALDAVKSLLKGINVANEGCKVSNKLLFLLKPFGKYLVAKDALLGSTSGVHKVTLLNASFILKREAVQQGDEELIKILSPLIRKDFGEISEQDVSNFLKYVKNNLHSNLGSVFAFLRSRMRTKSRTVGFLISKVLDELQKSDCDIVRLSKDLIALYQVESSKFESILEDFSFVKGIYGIQLFFPFFCTKLSPELMRASVPRDVKIPPESVMKSQEMSKLGSKFGRWLARVFYSDKFKSYSPN